uniref:Protein transport protein Sec31A n=3 Tax=Parascaris univalens TaxID=6257 RepID=A0A914ZNZ4_PARUN
MNKRRIFARNGVFTWSGSSRDESGLIMAEAAQQIDFSRDTSASFFDFVALTEIMNATSPLQHIKPTHSVSVDFKLNDIAWSSIRNDEHPSGLIIGGGESGVVAVFDAASLLRGEQLNRVGETRYHQGHVLSVDVSTVNSKWVCSGGALGSILLWDMNSPLNPMSPGTPNFNHQIKCVGWNRCVEHILGSLTNERCSIWDLRRGGSPILDIADIGGGVEWSIMRWSPLDGTTLCLASQSDMSPIVQKWDLRYASAPVLTYQLHSRGIFGMDWNAYDGNLLATVGRDEQVLIHNPGNGHLLGRVAIKGWARCISWNPTNPNLFAISFFDRPLEVHSLTPFPSVDSSNEVSDATELELSVIPAWMGTGSCGVRFSYGNKICTFEVQPHAATNTLRSVVLIKKIQENRELGRRVTELQTALDTNQLSSFCEQRALSATDDLQTQLWTILSKQTLNSSRSDYLVMVAPHDHGEVRDDALEDVLKQMDSCQLSREEDSEDEQLTANREQIQRAIAPISFQEIPIDEKWYLDSLCDGEPRKAIAAAVMRKEWTLALLLAQANADQNVIRFIAQQIDRDSSSCGRTRLAALMAAGMWDDVLHSWDLVDWRRLFALILAQAPSYKIRPLCSRLCKRMIIEGRALEAGLPAVIAGDVDSLMDATESLALDERIAIAAVLRHSLGGGSSRTVNAGPRFQAALEEYARQLAEEGFVEAAWKLTESIDSDNCTEELMALRHTLYNVCGSRDGARLNPLPDPFAAVRQHYSKLGYPKSKQTPECGAPRALATRAVRYSGDSRRSVEQLSPGLPQQLPYATFMPTQPTNAYHPHCPPPSEYWNERAQPAVQNVGYAFVQSPASPVMQQPPPVMSGSSMNGYATSPPMSSVANGYYPEAYANVMHSAYAPAPPPPPPAAPYGSLPSGGARIRTMSTASHSSIPPSTADTTTSDVERNSQPIAKQMSISSGWNDPPVVAAKKSEVHSQIAEIRWKPAAVDEYAGFNTLRAPVQPSQKLVETEPQQAYTLSEADNYIVATISTLVANIRQLNKTPMVTHKMTDVEHKVSAELVPRLARANFSQQTLAQLYHMAHLMSSGDFRSCQVICADLVRGNDFVELSPIVPALKMLISTAQQVYRR